MNTSDSSKEELKAANTVNDKMNDKMNDTVNDSTNNKSGSKSGSKLSIKSLKSFYTNRIWLPVWLPVWLRIWLPIKHLWSKKEGKYLISGLSVVLVFTFLLIGFLLFKFKNTPATKSQQMDSTSLTANVDSLENGAPLTLIAEDGGHTLIQNGQTTLVPPGKYTLQTFVDGNGGGNGTGNGGSVKGVQERVEIGKNEKKQVSLSLKPITLDESKAIAKPLNNPISTTQILGIKPVKQNAVEQNGGSIGNTVVGTGTGAASIADPSYIPKINYPSIVLPKLLAQTSTTGTNSGSTTNTNTNSNTDNQTTNSNTNSSTGASTDSNFNAAAIVQPALAKYSLINNSVNNSAGTSNAVLPTTPNSSSGINSGTSDNSQSSGSTSNSPNSNPNPTNSDSSLSSGSSSSPSASSNSNLPPSPSPTPSNIPIESTSTLVAQTKEGQVILAQGCEVSKVMFDASGTILKYFKACDNGQNGFYQYDLSSKVETQILPTSDSSNQIKVDSSSTQDLMVWTKPEYGQFGIIKGGKSETILSNTYFTAPTFSPDGKYIIVMDNYLVNLSDKQKSDLKLTNSNQDQFGLRVKVVSTEDLLQNKDKANFKQVGTTYYIPRPIDYSFDFTQFTDSTHFMAGDSSKIFSLTGEPEDDHLVSDQPGRIFETSKGAKYRLYQNTLFNSKNEPLVSYVQKVYQLANKTFYFKVGDFLFRLVDDTPVQAYPKPISSISAQNDNIELILTDGQVVRF